MSDKCPKCGRPSMRMGGSRPIEPGPYCCCWILDSESVISYVGGDVPTEVALGKVQGLRRQLAAAEIAAKIRVLELEAAQEKLRTALEKITMLVEINTGEQMPMKELQILRIAVRKVAADAMAKGETG